MWLSGGFLAQYLDSDMARDLSALSSIWLGRLVWVGPKLSAGFHATSLFYYSYFPALLLGKGDPRSLIVFSLFLTALAVTVCGYYCVRKFGVIGLIAPVLMSFLPWVITTAPHFGNGYSYALWLLLGLALLFFTNWIFISALCIGIAFAFHPAALFALVLLGIYWVQSPKKIQTAFAIVLGLTLPWTPTIGYEVITKGFLTRQLLQHHSTSGITFGLNTTSLSQFASMLGLTLRGMSALWLSAILIAQKGSLKTKWWLLINTLSVLTLFGVSSLHSHYLLGLLALTSFTLVIVLLQKKWGVILLCLWCMVLVTRTVQAPPLPPANRSIVKIDSIVDTYLTVVAPNIGITSKTNLAVVAATSPNTEVPQADDYRFFFRTKGYTVLEVAEYSQAEVLIQFIEVPNFNWQGWSTWETEQFGNKTIVDQRTIQGFQVITFTKKD